MRSSVPQASRAASALAFALLVLGLAFGLRGVARAQSAAQPPTAPPARAQPPVLSPGAPQQTPAPPAAAPTNDEDPCAPDETPPEAGSWIGAGFGVGLLNLPKLGIGLELIGELRVPGMWPIELSGVYWLENDDALNLIESDLVAHPQLAVPYPPGGSRLHMQETLVSAALCPYEFQLATGSFLACGGASGGVLRGSGKGFVEQTTVTRGLFQLDAYARWHFRLGAGVGITYSAGLFIPFMRDRFGYHDRFGVYRQQFRIAPLGGRLDLALTYGF